MFLNSFQYDHNTSNTSSGYGEGPVSPLTPAGSQGQSVATRTVISEMRRQFLNGGAAESNPAAALPPRQPPKVWLLTQFLLLCFFTTEVGTMEFKEPIKLTPKSVWRRIWVSDQTCHQRRTSTWPRTNHRTRLLHPLQQLWQRLYSLSKHQRCTTQRWSHSGITLHLSLWKSKRSWVLRSIKGLLNFSKKIVWLEGMKSTIYPWELRSFTWPQSQKHQSV